MLHFIVLGIYLLLVCLAIFFLILLLGTLLDMLKGNSPFVPIRNRVLPEITSLFQEYAPITPSSLIVDPGCGNGKVLVYLAQAFPHTQMIGIEKNLLPFLIAKWKTRKERHITIIKSDIFNYDYRDTTHVFTYLFPELMDPLCEKIKDQAQPGTVLISCDFVPQKITPIVEKVLTPNTLDAGLAKKLYLFKF